MAPRRRNSPNGRSVPSNGSERRGTRTLSALIIIQSFPITSAKADVFSMQLILGMLALQRTSAWSREEVVSAVFGLSTGIAITYIVYRFVYRNPWPRPFNVRFAALHIVAASAFAFAWVAISSMLVALVMGTSILTEVETLIGQRMFIGIFVYIIVAGISYAVEGAGRAARAEALAARTQLAALRAQLHPHFL